MRFYDVDSGEILADGKERYDVTRDSLRRDCIMRLPEGYNRGISEGGGNISKGQKQLLTIAWVCPFVMPWEHEGKYGDAPS